MTITFSCGTLNFIESLVNLWNSAVMLLLSFFLFYATIIQTNIDVSPNTTREAAYSPTTIATSVTGGVQ